MRVSPGLGRTLSGEACYGANGPYGGRSRTPVSAATVSGRPYGSRGEKVTYKSNRSPGRVTAGQASIRALLDESAVLACLAYADLNPVRAAIAETPEDSDYTSVQRRIRTLQTASESSADGENVEKSRAAS